MIFQPILFVSILFRVKNYHRKKLHSANNKELKASAEEFKGQRTLYDTNVGFSYSSPSDLNYQKLYSNGYCRLLIKEDGLLFKPIILNKFGLKFKNIVSIQIENEKSNLRHLQYVTINSISNVTNKIVFVTNMDVLLIDEIMRHYDGEITGYDI